MANDPDPGLKLSTTKGVTRTLDDWTTMFHLTLVILPPRPEAATFVPIAERIFTVFGDADCHTAFCVTGNEFVARSVLGDAEQKYLTFVDPDLVFVKSLGLTHLPAIVHLRQDDSIVAVAEGWDPDEWQRVVRKAAKALAWTYPEIRRPGDPAPTPGWSV